MSLYLLTPTLLNEWLFACSPYGSGENFKKALTKSVEHTAEMDRGLDFEKWAYDNIEALQGAVRQVKVYAEYGRYLVYGKMDALRAGVIYEIKRPSSYDVGKYRGKMQTPAYLWLTPDAHKMVYVIGTTQGVCYEEYTREDVDPLPRIIDEFTDWLRTTGLEDLYLKNWGAKD